MYAYLEGKIAELTPAYAVIDCGGVGYLVNISLNTYSQIKDTAHAKILTHLIVREDAQTLYGFFDEKERRLFLLLISVSGVGAGTARMILSALSHEELASAILNGDVQRLQAVKGIGAKSAQRIIVDLKDKIGKEHWGQPGEKSSSALNTNREEALSALVMLGFNKSVADKALQNLIKDKPMATTEELIKSALKVL